MGIDLSNTSAFLKVGVGVLILLCALVPYNGQILQYLFYLRVPLICGALLLALPYICIYQLPSMLGNLFVLQKSWQMTLVILGAVAAGLGVVLVGAVIGANACERFRLIPILWLKNLAGDSSVTPYILAPILAIPTAWAAYWSSGPASKEMSDKDRRLGAMLGALLSFCFLFAVYLIRCWLPPVTVLSDFLNSLFNIFPEHFFAGYIVKNELGHPITIEVGHAVLLSFLLISILLYLFQLFLYRPTVKKDSRQLPAISYVLGLLQIFCLLLGLLSFFLDFFRVPVMLPLMALSFFAYKFWNIDHYYDIHKSNISAPKPSEVFQAVKNRIIGQESDNKTLVVICASGGGIQAAGWTTMVLTGLQQQLGPDFTKAIGLISAVSGGSVGALHFIDRFNGNPAPKNAQLKNIFEASTIDSLGVTGWGLVYPDLWRFVGLPFLTTHPRDRGSAINLKWKSEMITPYATLRDWIEPIKKGLMPIPVFNATIVEDGRQFLLSPMTFGIPETQGLEFNGLYKDCDVDASTAALLSATFPYVTPVTRNSKEPQNDRNFHVADGGYFDNFGVVTAIDWLDRLVLQEDDEKMIKNVIFVEIRAFPDEPPLETATDDTGWKMVLLGPLLTIFGARNSTQSQRNKDDLKDLIDKWHKLGVEIKDFKITFPENVKFFTLPTQTKFAKFNQINAKKESKKEFYKPPLSWKLTTEQQGKIELAWIQIISSNPMYKLKNEWLSLSSSK